MSQPKPYERFLEENKVVEFPSQPSPPLPAEANPLVKQQEANAIDAQTPTQSIPGYFLKVTKITLTLEQEDGITHYHIRPNLVTKMKQVSNVTPTHNTSYLLQDPQNDSSHSIVGEANEITTEQVKCQQQQPEHGFRTNTKHKCHQPRLCYNCRQTGHFIKNCPQLTEKGII